MAIRDLVMTGTGMTKIQSLVLSERYTQPAVTCELVCVSHTLAIGDTVTEIDFGWGDDHAVMLAGGTVKRINYNRPEQLYTILVHDKLHRAVDYFMASDDPDSPFQVNNVEASVLVGQLLAQAGLTSYSGSATAFTFAPNGPSPLNLISAWDAIDNICRITGQICYVQADGTVRFVTRKPYIVGGDTSEYSLSSGSNIEEIEYEQSDEALRNRVVVYGGENNEIHASASASSPYLPANFYKTIVVAHPLISSLAQAQATADLNLTMFNRLTETVKIKALGKPAVRIRDVVDVTDSFCGLSADEFIVYGADHVLGPDGYSMNLTLVR